MTTVATGWLTCEGYGMRWVDEDDHIEICDSGLREWFKFPVTANEICIVLTDRKPVEDVAYRVRAAPAGSGLFRDFEVAGFSEGFSTWWAFRNWLEDSLGDRWMWLRLEYR